MLSIYKAHRVLERIVLLFLAIVQEVNSIFFFKKVQEKDDDDLEFLYTLPAKGGKRLTTLSSTQTQEKKSRYKKKQVTYRQLKYERN